MRLDGLVIKKIAEEVEKYTQENNFYPFDVEVVILNGIIVVLSPREGLEGKVKEVVVHSKPL